MVDSLDDLANDLGNAINFSLLGHVIDLIVECLGNLEDGVNQETIIKLASLLTEEGQHLLAKFLLHSTREVIEQREQILKPNQL